MPNTRYQKRVHGNRIRSFVERILIWFDSEGRYFPWRNAGESKYRLIVTEILLQRTRAQTVAKFYDTFFEEFACWESIATADILRLEEVLKPLGMWKQRAPRLKALAESIMQLGGVVPTSYAAARSLPAVGQYVANAILLFQDVQKLPLLDAGMARVLERYFGSRDLADIRFDPYLQALSKKVVNHERAVSINWAILDFSALICVRNEPKCYECPLRSGCCYQKL